MKKIRQFLDKYKNWIFALALMSILFESFFFSTSNSFQVLLITALWVFLVLVYKFEREISISSGLIFLSFIPVLLIFKSKVLTEKAAIWAYVFLVIGTIQAILAYWKENGKKTE